MSEPNTSGIRRLVLAFYYPWYGSVDGPSGSWEHWDGVHADDIRTSTDYPLLGPYDSHDERVIRAHIAMARAAGIDGFICSWWGIDSFTDRALRRILKVAERERFGITIYYESVRELLEDQVVGELSYVLSEYSRSPAWLKVDGRPVVFVYALAAMGRDPLFWKRVLTKVRERTGVDALFIGDSFDVAFLEAFDGLHTYNPIWIVDHAKTFREVAERIRARSPRAKIWCATVCPGYNDTKIRRPGVVIHRYGGEYYRATWEGALASNPDMILICTWNEWHEGTEIEPSLEHGFMYLRLTRELVSKFKGMQPAEVPPPDLTCDLRKVAEPGKSPRIQLAVENTGEGAAVVVEIMLLAANAVIADVEGPVYVAYGARAPGRLSAVRATIPYLEPGESARVYVSLRTQGRGSKLMVRVRGWGADGKATSLRILEVPL